MQVEYLCGVGDFAKFALLRGVTDHRRLAVCWYLTSAEREVTDRDKHFEYLKHPDRFRHLSPEVFDHCKQIVDNLTNIPDPVTAVQTSGLFGNAFFHRREVPKQASLRRKWSDELVRSVNGASLVYLDPDYGIEGRRLTPRHVALAEIAALRQSGRALIISHRQSGRKAEAKFLMDRMQELGCQQIELVRFRVVSSRFYIICDHDEVMSQRVAAFVKKWGDWVKSYKFVP